MFADLDVPQRKLRLPVSMCISPQCAVGLDVCNKDWTEHKKRDGREGGGGG